MNLLYYCNFIISFGNTYVVPYGDSYTSLQNFIILFWKYIVDIRREAWLHLFWEYINGKLFAVYGEQACLPGEIINEGSEKDCSSGTLVLPPPHTVVHTFVTTVCTFAPSSLCPYCLFAPSLFFAAFFLPRIYKPYFFDIA
jgi:hypothetical protein